MSKFGKRRLQRQQIKKEEIKRKIKRANSRLKRLEKSGYDYYAYDIAKHFIDTVQGTKYYSLSGIDFGDKYSVRVLEMSLDRFLSSKSSTVTGQRAIENERLAAFESKGLTGTREEKVEFIRWLGEDGYRNMVEAIGYGKEEFGAIIENYNYYKDTDRIDRIINTYMRNQDDYAGFIKRLEKRTKKRNGTHRRKKV